MEGPLIMDIDARTELLDKMAAMLGVAGDIIGRVLDEAASHNFDLNHWAAYHWRPGSPIETWPWHPGTLYHGGQTGLRVGQLLLPPSVTGVKPADERATYAEGVYRRDRVYMTTDPEQARMFAALHESGRAGRAGDVYRVEPLQGLERDRDCVTPGLSWQAPCARIVGIVATSIRRAPYEKALKEFKAAKGEPQRPLRSFTPQ